MLKKTYKTKKHVKRQPFQKKSLKSTATYKEIKNYIWEAYYFLKKKKISDIWGIIENEYYPFKKKEGKSLVYWKSVIENCKKVEIVLNKDHTTEIRYRILQL